MSRNGHQPTWQPIDTMPLACVVEVLRPAGVKELAARVVLAGGAVVIASLVRESNLQILDALAWRDVPGAGPIVVGVLVARLDAEIEAQGMAA